MSDTHKCVRCSHTKEGRFTRINSGRSGTWTKASLPAWWCYTCLPLGEGRGEDGQQAQAGHDGAPEQSTAASPTKGRRVSAAKRTAGLADPLGSKAAAQAASVQQGVRAAAEEPAKGESLAPAQKKTQGLVVAQVTTLATEVAELSITTDALYEYADGLLGRARNAVKVWEPIWDRIQEKVIKPQRAALEELYSLNRDIEGPALKLQTAIKAKMRDYKLAEARRLQAEQDARDREAARLIAEAQEKEKALEAAKTPAMRERLRTALEGLNTKAEEVLMETSTAPVMGISSGTRVIKKARVGNWEEFATFLLDDSGDVLTRDTFLRAIDELIQSRYRVDKTVAHIPGIELYDDIGIVGRG